jgi:hypothetical protein
MKKRTLLLVVLSVQCISYLSAQSKFYIQANTGYSMSLFSQPIGLKTTFNMNSSDDSRTESFSVVNSSLGSGFNGGLFAGYIINDFMAVELGVNYINSVSKQYSEDVSYLDNKLMSKETYSIRANIINISPGIRLFKSVNSGELFIRLAPLFGIVKVNEENKDEVLSLSPTTPKWETTETSREYHGGLAYGMFFSAGYKKSFGEHVGVSMELFSNFQTYNPTKGTMKKYTENGVDRMSNLSVSDKEIEFVDEHKETSNSNTSEPNKLPRTNSLLLSGIGLQVGVQYKF